MVSRRLLRLGRRDLAILGLYAGDPARLFGNAGVEKPDPLADRRRGRTGNGPMALDEPGERPASEHEAVGDKSSLLFGDCL